MLNDMAKGVIYGTVASCKATAEITDANYTSETYTIQNYNVINCTMPLYVCKLSPKRECEVAIAWKLDKYGSNHAHVIYIMHQKCAFLSLNLSQQYRSNHEDLVYPPSCDVFNRMQVPKMLTDINKNM